MPNWKKIIVSGSDASLSSAYIEGNLTASAAFLTSASIGHLETIYETASVIYSSGSTKFGDTSDDTHERTGSLLVSGNITLSEGTQLTGTSSFAITSSHTAGTASFSNISTLSRGGSGSFSGSFQGDGSGLTGVSVTADPGYSNDITLTSDFTTNVNTYNSLYGPLTVGAGTTVTVSVGSFLKVEDF